jgi:hypothetical protein
MHAAFQFLLVSEVPKKGYQTLLDWVMSGGLLVQLITCLFVFLNADNPHDPDWDRSAFYSLSDSLVNQIEYGYLYVCLAPWVAFNVAIVIASRFKLLSHKFAELTHEGQQWINNTLATDENGLVTGTYKLVRCSEERTEESVTMIAGVRTTASMMDENKVEPIFEEKDDSDEVLDA